MTKQERVDEAIDDTLYQFYAGTLTEETLEENLQTAKNLSYEMGCDEYEAS
ncbi:hypothetical protein [Salibacterium lacus]|uniref:Uncharacterized protein n=1 Tax=Salibacterium lacus TaxID=1898109 RepID=A0ABW5SWR0_9BACI